MSTPRPDDKLTVPEVAELLGIKPSTWRSYVRRGQRPAPDGHHDQRTPYWLRSTIVGGSASPAPAAAEDVTLAQLLGTLDALAAAARSDDVDGYQAALRVAADQGVTDEQITDAYRWGRRGLGFAAFDVEGQNLSREVVYDANNECTTCGAHLAEPHGPGCRHGD